MHNTVRGAFDALAEKKKEKKLQWSRKVQWGRIRSWFLGPVVYIHQSCFTFFCLHCSGFSRGEVGLHSVYMFTGPCVCVRLCGRGEFTFTLHLSMTPKEQLSCNELCSHSPRSPLFSISHLVLLLSLPRELCVSRTQKRITEQKRLHCTHGRCCVTRRPHRSFTE